MAGISEKYDALLKIFCSCIPHLSYIVNKGRYEFYMLSDHVQLFCFFMSWCKFKEQLSGVCFCAYNMSCFVHLVGFHLCSCACVCEIQNFFCCLLRETEYTKEELYMSLLWGFVEVNFLHTLLLGGDFVFFLLFLFVISRFLYVFNLITRIYGKQSEPCTSSKMSTFDYIDCCKHQVPLLNHSIVLLASCFSNQRLRCHETDVYGKRCKDTLK